MLTTKRRLIIILILIISGIISFLGVIIARTLDLRMNVKDPLYFDSVSHSRFLYDNGTHVDYLDFDSIPINSTRAICNIMWGELNWQFNVTPDGRYIDSIYGETQNFTIFWVHIVEPGSSGSETTEHVGNNYSIWDPIGILGSPDTEYVLTITDTYVYWAEEPALNGAQFSLKFEVRDLNHVKIAEGEMDTTCGMLFILKIGTGSLRTIELIDTNYEISRNRLTGWPIALAVAIIMPIVVFAWLHFRKREPLEENLATTILVAFGSAAFIIDIMIDVWMYAPLGYTGNLFLHLSIVILFAVYALWRKIGLKWVIPAFLEVAFLFAMVRFTGDAYVPHLTAFMGILISWLCLVWASGYIRPESKSKLGKFFSEFV